MPADDRETARILNDRDKRITGDLRWLPDDSGGHEFTTPVLTSGLTTPGLTTSGLTTPGELIVRGQRCPAAGTTRFALILRGTGRIAALDLGHAHTDTGELHFHRGAPTHAEPVHEPVHDLPSAWRLFCRLARITHDGHLGDPPPAQETLL